MNLHSTDDSNRMKKKHDHEIIGQDNVTRQDCEFMRPHMPQEQSKKSSPSQNCVILG